MGGNIYRAAAVTAVLGVLGAVAVHADATPTPSPHREYCFAIIHHPDGTNTRACPVSPSAGPVDPATPEPLPTPSETFSGISAAQVVIPAVPFTGGAVQ